MWHSNHIELAAILEGDQKNSSVPPEPPVCREEVWSMAQVWRGAAGQVNTSEAYTSTTQLKKTNQLEDWHDCKIKQESHHIIFPLNINCCVL